MFKCEFDTDNDAFTPYPTLETARILRSIADMLEQKHTKGVARDRNGNTIGRWELELEQGDGDL